VKDRDDPLTELVAKTIIKIAQSGIKDPAKISAQAISELEMREERPEVAGVLTATGLRTPASDEDCDGQGADALYARSLAPLRLRPSLRSAS